MLQEESNTVAIKPPLRQAKAPCAVNGVRLKPMPQPTAPEFDRLSAPSHTIRGGPPERRNALARPEQCAYRR